MKGFLRKLPIEFYVIVIPSLAVIALLRLFPGMISGSRFGIATANVFFDATAFRNFYIAAAILLALVALFFMLDTIASFASREHSFRESLDVTSPSLLLKKYFASVLYLFVIIGSIVAGSAASVSILFNAASPQAIERVSGSLMGVDRMIFGTYPSFAVQPLSAISWLERAVLGSYFMLYQLIALVVILLLFKDKRAFRFLALAYFLCYALSWPVWFFWPALSPQEMYRVNTLKTDISPEISAYIEKYPPSGALQAKLDELNEYWIDPAGERYAVSSNPSMHIAWGLVLVFAAFMVSRYLSLFFIPWFALNAIGTLYTFQHYAIDIVTGLLVGAAAMYLAKQLLKFDSTYFHDSIGWFSVFGLLGRCASEFQRTIRNAAAITFKLK